MSNSICRFMPAKNYDGNIKPINFVYETDFKDMKQPFLKPIYHIYLVTRGNGVLKMCENEFSLKKGDVFFGFPGCPFEIDGSDDFEYLYISFTGTGVPKIFENLQIDYSNPVYPDFGHVEEFWRLSIRRINSINSNILTESVLLYTLSFINSENDELNKSSENLFEKIVNYVCTHYTDMDMSLKKISYIFSYTEKYLSHLFKKNMNMGFNSYLNNIRIQYALELIDNRIQSVAELANMCGYRDSLYFSKVFKKVVGISPKEHIKKISEDNLW